MLEPVDALTRNHRRQLERSRRRRNIALLCVTIAVVVLVPILIITSDSTAGSIIGYAGMTLLVVCPALAMTDIWLPSKPDLPRPDTPEQTATVIDSEVIRSTKPRLSRLRIVAEIEHPDSPRPLVYTYLDMPRHHVDEISPGTNLTVRRVPGKEHHVFSEWKVPSLPATYR